MRLKNKIEINYLFYGIIFLFIALTTITNILSLENIQSDYRSFFILHCIGQALLEVVCLILIGYFIEQYFPKYAFYTFIGLSFLFFLTHIIDFILIRIMDLSFWDALGVVLDETLSNFIEMLILTGVPLIAWTIIFIGVFIIPVIGIIIYKLTKKISNKKPLLIKNDHLLQGCFCLILAIFLWDLSASFTIRSDIYQTYQNSLPWKTTFLTIKNKIINIPEYLPLPPKENNQLYLINDVTPLSQKPNIYIFVIESLREDFISKNISPTLYTFKHQNISFDLTLSNSNNTHCSWYSIFYSKYPFNWAELKKNKWDKGSIPLNILKKAGYKINVLTSSGLHYYKMDDLLFGKNQSLL